MNDEEFKQQNWQTFATRRNKMSSNKSLRILE